MKAKTSLAWAWVLVLAAACGGGGHSPTAPSGFSTFATVLINQGVAATIQDVKLVVDGVVVAESAATAPAAIAVLAGQGSSLSAGNHTLSVVIVAQTASPSPYTALAPDISTFDAAGNRLKEVKLADRSASLATGQSIDYTFTY